MNRKHRPFLNAQYRKYIDRKRVAFGKGCPICGTELSGQAGRIRKDSGEYKLWYSHTTCPFGHYSVDFDHGKHSMVILGHRFIYRKGMSNKSVINHSKLFAAMMLRGRLGRQAHRKRHTASMFSL